MTNRNDPMTVGDAFKHAVGLHQANRLREAEHVFRQILQVAPTHTEAAHYIGICLSQRLEFAAALPYYGLVLRVEPKHVSALNNLGNALKGLGRHGDALGCYDQALAVSPQEAFLHCNRGNALQALGRFDEALQAYDRAIALDARHVNSYFNRGTVLGQLGRHQGALADFARIIALNPNHAAAYGGRGLAWFELERYREADADLEQALRLDPGNAKFLCNRARALLALDRREEALASYDQAIGLNPGLAEAHSNRAFLLRDLGRHREALASFDRFVELVPDSAEAHAGRGATLVELRRYDEALVSCDRAISLKPGLAEAYANRGTALRELRRHEEALASSARALALKPDLPYLPGDRLFHQLLACDWDGLDQAIEQIGQAVDRGERASTPFVLLAVAGSAARQQRCARTYALDKFPAGLSPLWSGQRYEHQRIRVGYFSADFHNHATAYLMAELLERHDRAGFEIFGFSFGPSVQDASRRRLEQAFDRFLDLETRTDGEIAALARQLEIDIAVDLKGYTKDARPGILALRPAPLQVNYLGYPGTMGATHIDYLIADATLIPEADRIFYDEKIVYLPDCYQVNDSTKAIADRDFSRGELGLPEDGFVFCCFNSSYKITPDVFACWMRVLAQVEGSVLWLFEGSPRATENLRLAAEGHGVAAERLVFAPPMDLASHLARHRQADLFLDTFHCNAHTTASDALWAGLPVLTCLGDTFAGRVAASLLKAIGLPELIARSHADYQSQALELAHDGQKLAAIRRRLAENRSTNALFDTARYTRHMEAAYRQMYEGHRAMRAPGHILVADQRTENPST